MMQKYFKIQPEKKVDFVCSACALLKSPISCIIAKANINFRNVERGWTPVKTSALSGRGESPNPVANGHSRHYNIAYMVQLVVSVAPHVQMCKSKFTVHWLRAMYGKPNHFDTTHENHIFNSGRI